MGKIFFSCEKEFEWKEKNTWINNETSSWQEEGALSGGETVYVSKLLFLSLPCFSDSNVQEIKYTWCLFLHNYMSLVDSVCTPDHLS